MSPLDLGDPLPSVRRSAPHHAGVPAFVPTSASAALNTLAQDVFAFSDFCFIKLA